MEWIFLLEYRQLRGLRGDVRDAITVFGLMECWDVGGIRIGA
jgi:hypothetical protein